MDLSVWFQLVSAIIQDLNYDVSNVKTNRFSSTVERWQEMRRERERWGMT